MLNKFSKPQKNEVITMVDLTTSTIKKIFNKQIRELTKKTLANESFDMQFSDRWVRSYA